MLKVWKQFGRHIDIAIMAITSLCVASMAWANINSKLAEHERHLAAIDTVQTSETLQMSQIQQSTARNEQKLDDVAQNVQDIKAWLRNRK